MKTGLVLEGGAIKGAYQVGAYMAFRKCGIKFDGFAGTSIGSFNAAILASGKYRELLDFWMNVNPGSVIGADEKLIKAINSDEAKINDLLKGSVSSLKTWIKGQGISTDPLMEILNELLIEEELRNSKKDFGLVTVKLKGLAPKYVYLDDIPEGKLYDYILASCYLPVFKIKKIIDDNIYLDGGFYDKCPVSLLLNKGYDRVYAIRINGVGIGRPIKKEDAAKVITIKPSRKICHTFEMNRKAIKDTIKMGYYDTLRCIKNFDGYKYCFRKRAAKYYDYLTRKISKRELERVKLFFKVDTKKEAVIKAVEYLAEKKYIDYNKVYNLYGLVRKMKKSGYKNHFVYDFVMKLKLI